MDIQTERRRLLDEEGGDDDPTGLLSEQEAYLRSACLKLYAARISEDNLTFSNGVSGLTKSKKCLSALFGGHVPGCFRCVPALKNTNLRLELHDELVN